ncbi:hypothetical protein [Goodfellowiella coeruleoviolacea]|uniref:Uncharacterized protein n=1 Tax=Goodfellowiella coeruleoviolacea TaxID=334858 RepID=A0AAE3GBY7_9PSEU|nr:hypothetical protein [Goodfellowiella coeruleoviolacea]MCP2164589.1 hypothetical protein [Goodfellowiella coeruleoviolacea]
MNAMFVLVLAVLLGAHAGCVLLWHHLRRQRDERDALRAHYLRQIEQLERDLRWERGQRYRHEAELDRWHHAYE